MGTLGCINDMLRRDKENRELRKRGRERMLKHGRNFLIPGKCRQIHNCLQRRLIVSERKSWKKKNVIKIRLSR